MNNSKQHNKQANKSTRKPIVSFLLILSIMLNLALVYVIFEKKDVEIAHQKQINTQQKASYTQSLTRLSEQLKQEITNSKKFGKEQQQYRDSLTQVLKNVEADRANLQRSMVLTQAQMKAYKRKIAAYEYLLVRKDSLMISLKEVNDMLDKKNDTLQIQVNKGIENHAKEKEKNEKLEQKLKNASGLKVKDIVIKRVNRRGRIKAGKVFRERHISKLQVHFSFIDNELIEAGNKSVMMLLKDEMGRTLIPSSGTGTFELDGQETSYTSAQTFLYDKTGQTVMFNYDKDKPLGKGKFMVELYSEGKKIGVDSFRVR